MAFRGKAVETIPPLICWCGGAVMIHDFGGGDRYMSCLEDIFHNPAVDLDRTKLHLEEEVR